MRTLFARLNLSSFLPNCRRRVATLAFRTAAGRLAALDQLVDSNLELTEQNRVVGFDHLLGYDFPLSSRSNEQTVRTGAVTEEDQSFITNHKFRVDTRNRLMREHNVAISVSANGKRKVSGHQQIFARWTWS